MDCLFCKIGNKEIPSKIIYEDDIVLVFLDINPYSVGHTLIIPKNHFKDIDDITDEVILHIFKVAKQIKSKLTEKLKCSGIKLVQNNGDCQDIKHYHLHLIPFYKNKTNLTIDEVYEKIMH